MIHSFKYCLKEIGEVGRVSEAKEFLVKVVGLPNAVVGEGVTFETGEHGRVLSLEKNCVEILVLSRIPVKPQTKVARTGLPISISCGEGLLGHVINTLGYSLLNRPQKSLKTEKRPIETQPLGIVSRQKISRFFATGVTLVDMLIPIGMGQRELIIGDRKTGKTHFLLQTLLTQARLGKICIYTAIGKRKIEIKAVQEFIENQKIFENCIVVAVDSLASPGEIYLAPYTGMTLAEYFRDQGKDVCLILDDLTTHAKYYREISLIAGRFPGRESYPGDIFHIHSKLLERAGNFIINPKKSKSDIRDSNLSVSITCLPVAESIGGDITGYIQTNLMSMTDGHIYFDSDIFYQGRRPAINVFLSVTRVGRQTYSPIFRDVSGKIFQLMNQYSSAQRFLKFGPELSVELKKILDMGEKFQSFFSQIGFTSVPPNLSVFIAGLILNYKSEGKGIKEMVKQYEKDKEFRETVGEAVSKAKTMEELNGNF